MKLKKIASLALAGVMAVGMLAGCGDNSNSSSTPTGDVDVTSTPAFVEAFNDAQSVSADVQIDFTAASDSLMSKVSAAVKELGTPTTSTSSDLQVLNAMKKSLGTNYVLGYVNTGIDETNFLNGIASDKAASHDGEKNTTYYVYGAYDAATYQTPEKVSSYVMTGNQGVQDIIDALPTKDPATVKPDQDYLTYSYTGSVGCLTAKTSTGATYYYVVVEITQTANLKTGSNI